MSSHNLFNINIEFCIGTVTCYSILQLSSCCLYLFLVFQLVAAEQLRPLQPGVADKLLALIESVAEVGTRSELEARLLHEV